MRRAGARVKLLRDGDVAAALATAQPDSGIDMLMGSGGGSQGVLAAAALRCAGGDMQARLAPRNDEEADRCYAHGITRLASASTRSRRWLRRA